MRASTAGSFRFARRSRGLALKRLRWEWNKGRTASPFASPFEVAGAGNGHTANLHGTKLETADTAKRSRRGTAPVLDPTALSARS
jgi:hypothetical protein